MSRKSVLVSLLALTLLSVAASAQTTKTLTFTVLATPCQSSVVFPREDCLGYIQDQPAVPNDGYDEWNVYVNTVNPDGSFSDGFINLFADFDDPDATTASGMTNFNSTSINGTED